VDLGPAVLGVSLFLAAVALTLGFLELRGRQRSEAAPLAGLSDNAQRSLKASDP
jgi:hypothetical protein